MKIKAKQKEIIILKLTMEELELLWRGVGKTSPESRVSAGMSVEQSEFFAELYHKIHRGGFFG